VEDQLKKTYTTERIAGADRYETSALVARKIDSLLGAAGAYRAFFARGDNFPDALALGPIAAGAQGVVMLVRTGSVPASVAKAVNDIDITEGYIAGDTTSVSSATATALGTLIAANGGSSSCVRWDGPNRYETAARIIDAGLAKRWIDLDTLGVATGVNFPDALGGGAALGYYGSPVLLTSGTALSPAAAAFLDRHQYEIGRVDVFGGTTTVSDTVKSAVMAKVK
jgi:putative cell wall-binding protein